MTGNRAALNIFQIAMGGFLLSCAIDSGGENGFLLAIIGVLSLADGGGEIIKALKGQAS